MDSQQVETTYLQVQTYQKIRIFSTTFGWKWYLDYAMYPINEFDRPNRLRKPFKEYFCKIIRFWLLAHNYTNDEPKICNYDSEGLPFKFSTWTRSIQEDYPCMIITDWVLYHVCFYFLSSNKSNNNNNWPKLYLAGLGLWR